MRGPRLLCFGKMAQQCTGVNESVPDLLTSAPCDKSRRTTSYVSVRGHKNYPTTIMSRVPP